MNPYRISLLLAGLAGLSAVILAAAGGHLVSGLEDPAAYRSWQSANLIHIFHAVVLLVLAAINRNQASKVLWYAIVVFALGITLFSGSIYLSHLSSIENATKLAPAGGLMLMFGWVLIIFHALKGHTE